MRGVISETYKTIAVCKYYELTYKGKPVAKHLDTVDKLLVMERGVES
ncbi:MAG: hypothetical protein KAJ64_05540 [Thermoplasmata archaeon]|nr:hypothetical protein [Thermoplasmata archaeon]